MGYIYNYKELLTKEDYVNQLKEIIAYRQLDGAPFDFGTGIMTSDFSLGSEDAYYEMDIWALESVIEYWDKNHNAYDMDIDEMEQCHEYWYPPIKHNRKQRDNKYARNRKYKDKMSKAIYNDWYPVWKNDNKYPRRYYRGKRSKLLKIQSNRKIRRYKGDFQKKGSGFHKVFDFWWELY